MPEPTRKTNGCWHCGRAGCPRDHQSRKIAERCIWKPPPTVNFKPKRMTEIVTVVYFTCENPDHRHQNKQRALSCVRKSKAQSERERKRQNRIAAIKDVLNGASYREAGEAHKLSSGRVREIVQNHVYYHCRDEMLKLGQPLFSRDWNVKWLQEHKTSFLKAEQLAKV